ILPNPELLLGDEATADALKKKGAQSSLLHIATHGTYRQDNPMFSGIRLGDGYLNLYDLYQMRLSARHVTLSGCATGMNFVAAGDELLGLQRGLFCAGAKEAALKAEKFVTCGDKVHAGGATAERDVAGGEAHLVEIVEVKVSIAEADAGEHGVVLAVGAVGGDVKEGALGPLFFEGVGGGLGAEEELWVRQDSCHGLDFRQNVGGALVGDAHD